MLPLLIGIAVFSGIAGTGAVLSAKEKFEKAENIAENAKRRYNRKKKRI